MVYKTIKEKELQPKVLGATASPDASSGVVNQLLDYDASFAETTSVMLSNKNIDVIRAERTKALLDEHPEMIESVSQEPFNQITSEHVYDLADKAKTMKYLNDLPHVEENREAFMSNAFERTYNTRQADKYWALANKEGTSYLDKKKHLAEVQKYIRLNEALPNVQPSSFIEGSADFVGSLAGSTGKTMMLTAGGAAAGATAGFFTAGPAGAAIGARIGGRAGMAAGAVDMYDSNQGKNAKLLMEANPDLTPAEALKKARLTSAGESAVEFSDQILGFGAGKLFRKAATEGVAKISIKGFLKEGAKNVAGEMILEEGVQAQLEKALIDSEKTGANQTLLFFKNIGADMVNLVDAEPLNETNKQILEGLKYGAIPLMVGGGVSHVWENRAAWKEARTGNPSAQNQNRNVLKEQIDTIIEQNKSNKIPSKMNKAIDKSLFKAPVAISVVEWNNLKAKAKETLTDKQYRMEFEPFISEVETGVNIETLEKTGEDINLPASEYLSAIGIDDTLKQDGLKFVKPNENSLSEEQEKLADYFNIEQNVAREDAGWGDLEDIVFQKVDKIEGLTPEQKDQVTLATSLRVSSAKNFLKDGADLEVEKFFDEYGFDIKFKKQATLTEDEKSYKQAQIENALVRKAKDEGKFEDFKGTNIDSIIANTKDKNVRKELKSIRKEAKKIQKTEEFKTGEYNKETKAVTIFDGGNVTTVLHEVQHWFDDFVETAHENKTLSEEYTDTWNGVRDYLGLEEGQKLSTENKENLANLFENYMENGSAPTFALKKLFTAIREMVLDVYGSILRTNKKINTKVKEYFDLQFATREQLRVARENDSLVARGDIDFLKNEKAQENYKKSLIDADNIERKLVSNAIVRRAKASKSAEITALKEKEYNSMIEDLKTQPVHIAQDAIISQGKFNKQSFEDNNYNTDFFRKEFMAKNGTLKIDFMEDSIDMIADMSGFENTSEMIDMVLKTPLKEEVAAHQSQKVAEAALDEKYGELSDEVYKSLRNDPRLDVLITESLWKENLTVGEINLMKKKLIEQANESMDDMSASRVMDIAKNRNNEVKTADLAVKAYANGNDVMASKYYEKAALNHIIAKEGYKANKTKTAFAKLKKRINTQKNIQEKLGKANYEAVTGVMNNFGIKTNKESVSDLKKSLDNWVSRLGNLSSIDTSSVSDNIDFLISGKEPGKSMKYFDFNLLYNVLDSMIAQSEAFEKINNIANNEALNEHYNDLISDLMSKKGKIKKLTSDSKNISKIVYEASNTVEPSLFNFMGEKFNKTIVRPLFKGFETASSIGKERCVEMSKLLKENKISGLSHKKNIAIDSLGVRLSESDLLMIAFNMGTKHNFKNALARVENTSDKSLLGEVRKNGYMEGLRMTDSQIEAVKEVIPSEYVEASQKVWKELEKDLSQTKQVYKDVNGEDMTLTTPDGFEFKGKKYKGGYFPMLRLSTHFNEEIEKSFFSEKAKTDTNTRHTRERTELVDGNLDLDPGRLFQHLYDSQIFIHTAMPYHNMGAIFNAKSEAITDAVGDIRFKAWRDWQRDLFDSTQSMKMTDKLEKYANFLTIGFKLKTAAIQPSALLNVIPYVGTRNLGRGFSKVMANPKNLLPSYVGEKSAGLSHREGDASSSIIGLQKSMKELSMAEVAEDKVVEYGFAMLKYLDTTLTANVAFEAGYAKAKNELGYTDAEARDYGDQIMRITQIDASKWSKSEAMKSRYKVLLPFHNYFFGVKSNITEAWSAGEKRAAGVFMLNFLIIASAFEQVVEGAVKKLLTGDEDENKKTSSFAREMAVGVAKNAVSITPLAVAPGGGTAVWNALNGTNFSGDLPVTSLFADLGAMSNTVAKLGANAVGADTGKTTGELTEKLGKQVHRFAPAKDEREFIANILDKI